jgi:hypothetical protein
MPLKLNVGLSRKVGEENYGSRGASVHLELELDAGCAENPERLRDRVRHLFHLARTSVEEELHHGPATNGTGSNGNGHRSGQRSGNGSRPSHVRNATASQVRALRAIAGRNKLDLTGEVRSRYGVDRPEELSISDASDLIDALKAPANGRGGGR